MDHHRPEGVDLDRAADEPRHAPRAHRARPAEAQGHHLLQVRHAPARSRDPAAAGDDRSRALQRGLHRQRPRQRRRHHRRAQQRLGRGEHDADGRARRPRHRRLRRRGQRVPRADREPARRPGRRPRRSGAHRWHRRRRNRSGIAAREARAGARQERRPHVAPEAGAALHAPADRPLLGPAGEVAESAHRGRAQHREADDERPVAVAARGRQRDHRSVRDGDGRRHARSRHGAGAHVVLARSVDLRRHRPGPAQHPR